MKPFEFRLNEELVVKASGEGGIVIGRAEFSNKCNQYLLRYKANDGRAVESWWDEDALALA